LSAFLYGAISVKGYLCSIAFAGKHESIKSGLPIKSADEQKLYTALTQVKEWVEQDSGKNAPKLDAFCEAFPAGDEDLKYEAVLQKAGMKCIRKYGIACFGKHCRVVMA
jgi:hypothetical protein